jgi:hypothetical protein
LSQIHSLEDAGESRVDLARRYQVWTYSVSHQQLLLRSTPQDADQTQIDILFKGVTASLLRPWYEHLSLRAPGPAERARIEAILAESPDEEHRTYVLSELPLSFVVASAPLMWSEGEGNYWDESPLLALHASGLVRVDP